MPGLRRLNNRKMRAMRKDPVYEAVLIDLVLLGVVKQEDAEVLIGRKIEDFITSPAVLVNDTDQQSETGEEDEDLGGNEIDSIVEDDIDTNETAPDETVPEVAGTVENANAPIEGSTGNDQS